MKNFEIQWMALNDRKKDNTSGMPKITKALPIIKWIEAPQNFLHQIIGVRMIPLSYVIHANVKIPGPPPHLIVNQPQSDEHSSVEAKLVAYSSHTHALYCDDNSSVYFHLKEATQGTTYATPIKPYQWHKNGRDVWMTLRNQYTGDDKWEAEIKKQDSPYTHTYGKVSQVSCYRVLWPNTEMHIFLYSNMLSMLNINCLTCTLMWDTFLRASNAQTLVCSWLWLVSILTTDHRECKTLQSHSCPPSTI